MTSLEIFEATTWTPIEIETIVRQQVGNFEYTLADNLRTAAMYCPATMPSRDFATAAIACGIRPDTATKRLNEVRRWQRELGEIA